MNKAVIYARYSTDKQTFNSIEGQIQVCREFAQRNNYTIVGTYVDEGISAKTDERPSFRKMIEDSSNKTFNVVIVYSLDRFARNRYDSAIYKKQLEKNGVKRLSATENITDSPEGVLMESVLDGLAEYYSLELRQKVKRGMKIVANKKQFTGGSIIFGYDNINKQIVKNENEAQVVIKVFERYLSEKNVPRIVEWLNTLCLNKRGLKWKLATVYGMLRNTKYIGVNSYMGETYVDVYEAIIDKELFYKVQELLPQPKTRAKRGTYALTNKITCGICGRSMCGVSAKQGAHFYYTCNSSKREKCEQGHVVQNNLETLVTELIADIIINKNNLDKFINDIISNAKENVKNNTYLKTLKKERAKYQKSMENILNAIKKGIYHDTMKSEMDNLTILINELEHKIIIEEKNEGTINKASLYTLFETMQKKASSLDATALIDIFVKSVVLNKNNILIALNTFDNVFEYKKTELLEISSSGSFCFGGANRNEPELYYHKGYFIISSPRSKLP